MKENVNLKTKELTFFQKLLQLYWIIPKKWLLESFELNDGILLVKTKNGNELKANLTEVTTKHLIDRSEIRVYYLTSKKGKKINFREVLGMLEENEWLQIFGILNPKETNLSKIGNSVKKIKQAVDNVTE